MDLFSGSFGCFKPVVKYPKSDVENDQNPKEKIKIWVLRCSRTGQVHYLEAFKDFVDVLLGSLMLRTGALIKLNREVSPTTKQETNSSMYGVYDSFKRLDDSVVLVDKEILLDPYERLRVSEELQALDSGDFECCNADCFKYLNGSRQICRSCTIATHFSCIICGGYFRENAHTSLCYTPWRPWRNHMTAAPILTRYTVIQSCPPPTNKPKREGYVKKNIPFIITNKLIITPLTTSNVSEALKNCGASTGEDLECNELSIGTPEVLVMLGAALTSATPLTDIFGKMCSKETRVSCSGSGASFSQISPLKNVSKCYDQDRPAIKGPTSITSFEVPPHEKMPKLHDHSDSLVRRPMTMTYFKFNPCKKNPKSHDHNDLSIRRPKSISSYKVPHDHDDSSIKRTKSINFSESPCPYVRMSRSHDHDDSSIRRETSTIKHAMMNQKEAPDQSSRQSHRQLLLQHHVQEQGVAKNPAQGIPKQSSLRRKKSLQRKIFRKILFQQELNVDMAPDPQPSCLWPIFSPPHRPPPQSPQPIASKSSFIELPNLEKTPQESHFLQQHLCRKSIYTPCSSWSSTPESQSIKGMASPIQRPLVSTKHILQQAPITRRSSSICSIDDFSYVSSQIPPIPPNSQSIINPLFQQGSSSDDFYLPMPSQPQTSPPSPTPSMIEDKSSPCISRQSLIVRNVEHSPTNILHRSYSPAKRQPQPGPTNIRSIVSFRKYSDGYTGIASLASAFEQGTECPSRYESRSTSSDESDGGSLN